MHMKRRNFLKWAGLLTVGGGLAAVGSYQYATRIGPTRLVVEHLSLPVAALPPALDGFKIVQLSDIHLYPHTSLEFVQQAIAQVNTLGADIVVLTGDYVLQQASDINDLAVALADLEVKQGVYAVLGNHDLWTDAQTVQRGLERRDIPVLRNHAVKLAEGLYLGGVDDVWSGKPDLTVTLADVPADVATVMLVHEPDWADVVAQDGRVSLQLSGHSHGGQVRIPGYGAPILPPYGEKYDMGLYQVQDMWLYTNRGLGVIAPVRFNCPPEITAITLRSV